MVRTGGARSAPRSRPLAASPPAPAPTRCQQGTWPLRDMAEQKHSCAGTDAERHGQASPCDKPPAMKACMVHMRSSCFFLAMNVRWPGPRRKGDRTCTFTTRTQPNVNWRQIQVCVIDLKLKHRLCGHRLPTGNVSWVCVCVLHGMWHMARYSERVQTYFSRLCRPRTFMCCYHASSREAIERPTAGQTEFANQRSRINGRSVHGGGDAEIGVANGFCTPGSAGVIIFVLDLVMSR
jgi:hypothetical protein